MSKRVTFHLPDQAHENPIGNATRKGNMIFSSGIFGYKPEIGKKGREHVFPEGLLEECRQLLSNMKTTVEFAGGTIDDIVRVETFMPDRVYKDALNLAWAEMFPDPDSQPTRDTTVEKLNYGRVRCIFTAVLD